MLSRYKSLYPIISAPVFIAFLIWAHAVAPEHYNFVYQTVNGLGAQGYAHRWILRLGLFAFGGMISLGVVLNGIRGRTLPILIYAICMAVTGAFSAVPWNDDLYYSAFPAAMNSMFSQLADWILVGGIFVQGLHSSKVDIRRTHYIFFAIVLVINLGTWFLPDIKGLLQRLLWMVGLYWLAIHFRTRGV